MIIYTGWLALVHPVPSIVSIPNWQSVIGSLCAGGAALLLCLVLSIWVMRQPAGSENMQKISRYIQQGAAGFLQAEYTAVSVYVFFVALGLGISSISYLNGGDPPGWQSMICFIVGAGSSALAGAIGMMIATRANVRTCAAAEDAKPGEDPSSHGLNAALRVAFNAGTVMGMAVCGIGILNLSWLFLAFPNFRKLSGYGFGATSISIFARVGGGIFTKAADVGADLVGKVEAGIPEDDPRNPGVIADNVGDNVGDVAGMGADLFGSFVGCTIAAGALGTNASVALGEHSPLVALPFWIHAAGIVSSMIGVFLVRTKELDKSVSNMDKQRSLLWSIRTGVFIAAGLSAGLSAAVVYFLGISYRVWGCMAIGLAAGISIGLLTELATSFTYFPTQGIAKAGRTGPATVIIEGLAVGMWSAVPPLMIIVVTIICCLYLAGPYGMSIAAVGMLATLGITLATDAYGPVADNAGGIAEMSPEVEDYVRDRTDALDALGNTTAATGKGFAIGSAVLTAFSYMVAYAQNTGIDTIDLVADPMVIPGLLLGAMLPFFFSSLTMKAVGSAAMAIVNEVRRQFREIPGLLEGRPGVEAKHDECVRIATRAALREMVAPALLPMVFVVVTGLLLGAKALAALVSGSIITAFMLAVTMANAGGAWDNAKKYVEGGLYKGFAKGSDVHKATVVGDTVGDPFKDTSGPALNIMIKMMSVLSLLLSPIFGQPWPFQGPQYWAGIIIGGVSIIAVIVVLLVRKHCAACKADDNDEMQESIKGTTDGKALELTEMPTVAPTPKPTEESRLVPTPAPASEPASPAIESAEATPAAGSTPADTTV